MTARNCPAICAFTASSAPANAASNPVRNVSRSARVRPSAETPSDLGIYPP
jgi:hypothetical protein